MTATTRIGRPPTCECGECPKCRARVKARERYQALTVEERRALFARRDAEKQRAADRARYRRDYEKRRAAVDEYQREHPEVATAAKQRWAERNPDKRAAHVAVGNAIRDGRLVKGPCERADDDCRGRIHAHHDDYSKPLEVRWLCTHHHSVHHLEERAAA